MLFKTFLENIKNDSKTFIEKKIEKERYLHEKFWDIVFWSKKTKSETFVNIYKKYLVSEEFIADVEKYKKLFPDKDINQIESYCKDDLIEKLIPINKKYQKTYSWQKLIDIEIKKSNQKIDEFYDYIQKELVTYDDSLDDLSEIFIDYTKNENQIISIVSTKNIEYKFYILLISGYIQKPHIRILKKQSV